MFLFYSILILDGSKTTLLAALNVLCIEICGDMSGFKVNINKTKLFWIGKKPTPKVN